MDDQLPIPQQLPAQPVSVDPSAQHRPPTTLPQLPAADSDTLELAWSHRAQETLAHAAQNPKQLASSFAEVKAAYIYARYGKQIPVEKEEA